MSRPLFSIVIPTYNRVRAVLRAIRSCREQTCQDFEIIVVDDDKSSEGLEAALAEFGEPRVRLVPRHAGRAAAARNTGIRLARGKYVALLDSDDEFLPTKLEACLRQLEDAPGRVCYSQTYVDRGVGRLWVKPSQGIREDEDVFDYLFVRKGWVHTSTVVLETELARASPYDERLSFGDDIQFAADLWRRGARLRMIEQPLATYDDRTATTKLSQSPIFQPGTTFEHESFTRWVEAQRPMMSARAEAGYRAFFLSRLVARAEPMVALRHIILDGYGKGAAGPGQCLGQMLQTFAPRLYRHLSDEVVRWRGLDPSEMALSSRR